MRRMLVVLLPLASLLAAACSSAAPAPEPQAQRAGQHLITRAATSLTPWHTYHRGPARAGHVAHSPGGPLQRPYDVTGWTLPMQMGIEAPAITSIRFSRSTSMEIPQKEELCSTPSMCRT